MRIVLNPGGNLTEKQIARYGVHLLPLVINVGGRHHDTRNGISFDDIDRFVASSREHPLVLGSSASDYVELLRTIALLDREILVLCGSRKIVGSYKAAISAVRSLTAMAGFESVKIEVVEAGGTDISGALCTVLAGESAKAGRTLKQTVEVVERFAIDGTFMFVPLELGRLVKSGRATWLRAWVADILDVSPIIGFQNGELAAVGKVARSADVADAIVSALVDRIGARRAVWAAVAHARAPEKATALAAKIQERFAVVHFEERPFFPTSYLQAGPAVGAFVYPIDRLPWNPPIPPRF